MFDVLTDSSWSPRLPIGCWLIEHPEGLIMVDTGESSHANDPGYQPWWHPFMQHCERRWVCPEEEAGPKIRALGFDPNDVRWVIMTHMHSDHAGGLGHFPKSEILLTEREARDALAWTGPATGFLNMHYPKWLKPKHVRFKDGPWESFEMSEALTSDGRVRIVPTPGHTMGHQSVVLDFDDHYVLIAGDASYNEAAMIRGEVDGVAQSAKFHHDSTRRMRQLCTRRPTITLFAHDPDSHGCWPERLLEVLLLERCLPAEHGRDVEEFGRLLDGALLIRCLDDPSVRSTLPLKSTRQRATDHSESSRAISSSEPATTIDWPGPKIILTLGCDSSVASSNNCTLSGLIIVSRQLKASLKRTNLVIGTSAKGHSYRSFVEMNGGSVQFGRTGGTFWLSRV